MIEYFTDDEAAALLQALKPKVKQPGDITRKMAAEAWGVGISAAGARLRKLVKEGKFTDEGVLLDTEIHKHVRVYRSVQKCTG